jgi:hypothetical protein
MNGVLVRGARGAMSASRAPARRGLAAHADEPVVPFSDYRAGKATFAEWVDANRHIVAGSIFAFYVTLAVVKFRPKKSHPAAVESGAAVESDAVGEAVAADPTSI